MGDARDDGVHRLMSGTNHMPAIMSAVVFSMLLASPAEAIRPDECEQQRALFPKEWNDVGKEKPLFFCWSHYFDSRGAFRAGRRQKGFGLLPGRRKSRIRQP